MHPSADSPAMSVPPLTDFQDEPADFGRYAGRGKMFSDLAVEYLHFLVSSGHPRATRARAELQHRGIPHQNLAENPSHSPAGAQAIVAPSLDRRWRSITRGGAGVPSYELLVPASRHYVEPHVDADKAMKWTERHFAFPLLRSRVRVIIPDLISVDGIVTRAHALGAGERMAHVSIEIDAIPEGWPYRETRTFCPTLDSIWVPDPSAAGGFKQWNPYTLNSAFKGAPDAEESSWAGAAAPQVQAR